jgi:ADP-dependent NAD(P)H-hydrate dehydratase
MPLSDSFEVTQVTNELLRDWPLPMPTDGGGKEERGHVLVIAGSREMPGAAILAATAAMRAGAGKLVVATAAGIAQLVASALPEARVIPLAETEANGMLPSAVDQLGEVLENIDAVLIGPGMQDEGSTCAFAGALLPKLGEASVVLDACAMGVVASADVFSRRQESAKAAETHESKARVLLTPHAGEMAHLSGRSKDEVLADPAAMARVAASSWNATIALKGSTTFIASAEGELWRHEGGNAGLGTSGSGDVLAGLIIGLAARGASLEQAAAWGVALHARAGERLAERLGPLGYLARELAGEVPALMHALNKR